MFGRFNDLVILICLVIAQIKEHMSYENSLNLPNKCCASDYIMETTHLGNYCEPNIDRRIYLLNKQSSYLNMNKSSSNSEEESCMDINNNTSQDKYIVSEYFLKNGTMTRGGILDLQYFYKCCPLGNIYNPQTHSCRADGEKITLLKFIENNYSPFIRIGLPHCKIIVDKYFSSLSDFVINKKDFSLFLKSSKEKLGSGSYCIDSTTRDNFVVRKCETDFSVCKKVSCLKKCCPDGRSFLNSVKYCRDTHDKGINISGFANISVDHQGNFAIVIFGSRCSKMYGLKGNYSIDENGIFNVREKLESTNISIKSYPIEEDSYCIEYMQKIKKVLVFRCTPQHPDQITQKFLLSRYSMMVSCIFLILTILCYFISLEIRSLFGKILVTYCICLFVLYALLVNSTYYLSVNLLTCKLLGFFTTYAHFSVFTWLNIMSFDIFDTFGSGIVINVSRKNRDLRRYLLYSSYGWGVPLALILIVIIFHYADIFPDVVKIAIGVKQCSIRAGQGNYAAIIFIFIPMSVMVLANVIMFIRTIRYCLAVKKEIGEMDDAKIFKQKKSRFKARKDQLFLIIKLCCIMGVALMFEVLSSFVNFKENSVTEKIEIIFDLFNTSQGLFIFIIFICKRRILNMMLQRMRRVELRRKSVMSDFTLYSSDPNTSIFISLKSIENINQQAKSADDKT